MTPVQLGMNQAEKVIGKHQPLPQLTKGVQNAQNALKMKKRHSPSCGEKDEIVIRDPNQNFVSEGIAVQVNESVRAKKDDQIVIKP